MGRLEVLNLVGAASLHRHHMIDVDAFPQRWQAPTADSARAVLPKNQHVEMSPNIPASGCPALCFERLDYRQPEMAIIPLAALELAPSDQPPHRENNVLEAQPRVARDLVKRRDDMAVTKCLVGQLKEHEVVQSSYGVWCVTGDQSAL
ncbi:MAG: hypothetical protein OXG79_12680 [Chloroflexi bacterium]|nr:hypothetical protein [Chloroflexota bacterium]